MLKANVGSSTNECPKTAGSEAARAAKMGLADVKMAFVYASCAYEIAQVIAGVKEELAGVPVLGNTSFTGVITPEGYVGGDKPFVGIMAFSDADMSVGIAAVEKNGCAIELGESLAKKAMAAAGKDTAPDYFYMAASPAEEEFYLKGMSKVIGRVPFFGGSAADNSIAGEWKLYAEDAVFADGCIVAYFYGGPKMTNLFTGAYRETNDFGVITKIDGNRTLMEIDGIPATRKYAQWRGLDQEAVTGGNLLVTTITSPLGIKDRLGDLIAIRHPMNGNDNGSMAIGNNLAEKTCVIRMEASVDELISSTGETLKKLIEKMPSKPLAFHLVHCGGRRAGIGDRINEVAASIKAAAGDIPYIVEFTFGEYGFESDNNNTCGGLMLSFTGFCE
ncbi:MAG: FIST N-terminal domain-containing protein [bacterium]|nr:FIST N-terminal domain-containing protein [bacterium]